MNKLIVSIATLDTGGAERVLSVLSKPFADSFDDVIYVLWEGGQSFYSLDSRIRIVSLPAISGKKGRIRQIRAFRNLIKQEKPSLVLSFLTPYNMLVLLSTLGLHLRIVVAERTDPNRILSGGRMMLLLRDLLYRRACGILTQTKYAQSCYDVKFKGKTAVIHNPLAMIESQVGMAINTPKENLVVSAGRLEPVKDQITMIEAFEKFHRDHQEYQLVIYGEGPIKEHLQKRINELKLQRFVTLAGRTNDLWNKIASAKVFLLTSEYEGMSNAMIEAMCIGLPVISTKVAGATEFIKDGENGYIVEVKDKVALCDRLTRLANDAILCKKMGEEAVKLMDLLRADRVCLQWVDYLKSMMNK